MERKKAKSTPYQAPRIIADIGASDLIDLGGRAIPLGQTSLFPKSTISNPTIYWAGDINLIKSPSVAVVGSRDVSQEGLSRAAKISKLLSSRGVTIVSGLAKGVDTAAHWGAIEAGGKTIAVIGTPINKSYPAENSKLQEEIYKNHLLLSQFPNGARTFPSDFPKRNKLMAAITDATIIVEASDTSGTLHQAAECVRLGRWLFIMKSVVENPNLNWPAKFLKEKTVAVLSTAEDVLGKIL